MAQLTLTKHHGLFNDFLVYQYDGKHRLAPDDVRRVCDRIEGFGADGLINVRDSMGGQGEFDMQLWNADGTRAEMSGNGIRCVAQALIDSGRSGNTVRIHTDAGFREVVATDEIEPGLRQCEVSMGTAKISHTHDKWLDKRNLQYVFVDVGNPHVVIYDPTEKYDIAELGAEAQSEFPGGINLELVYDSDDGIHMRVYERGVGITASCGTGCVASAAAMQGWNKTGDKSDVIQPGGTAGVERRGEEYFLSGPVKYVGQVIVDVTH